MSSKEKTARLTRSSLSKTDVNTDIWAKMPTFPAAALRVRRRLAQAPGLAAGALFQPGQALALNAAMLRSPPLAWALPRLH